MDSKAAAFVRHYVRRGSGATAAALAAGYGETYARHAAARLLSDPEICAALERELTRAVTAGAVIGYQTSVEIARDAKLPAGARMTAARTLLEVGGRIGKRQDDGGARDLSELSVADLREMVDRLDKEIIDRAKPVNGTVLTDQSPQLTEMLD